MPSPDFASAWARLASAVEAAAAAIAVSRSASRAASGPGSSTLAKAATWVERCAGASTAVLIPRRLWTSLPRMMSARAGSPDARRAAPISMASSARPAPRRGLPGYGDGTDWLDIGAPA